ncbi:MAG: hypothetical protein C5B48_03495 [Candidatus Rokuibacteriota bacterium]|nr:MAG: hypothetical protein C5B48_03495 [Candidatus Rokubacteria bacterium]
MCGSLTGASYNARLHALADSHPRRTTRTGRFDSHHLGATLRVGERAICARTEGGRRCRATPRRYTRLAGPRADERQEEEVMRCRDRWIRGLVLPGTLVGGIAVGALGQRLNAAQPTFSETPLLRTDLAGLDRYELIVSRLETTPGWAHGRHYHAGYELVYVLEGTGALEVEGTPGRRQRLEPGTVAYIPPRQIHAGRNASGTAAFKFLLIRIHVKGEPISFELN